MPAGLEELAELDASENGIDDEQGGDDIVNKGASYRCWATCWRAARYVCRFI